MATEVDVVIIGGGPSGLAGALYTGRAEMKTVVLERKVLGGQIVESADVDNYPGFPDGISGGELAEKMQKHVEKFDVDIRYESVKGVERDGPYKIVTTAKETYRAPIVIIASGADHRHLNIPGEERLANKGVSYCATCDGAFFKGEKLAVVGAGDSATTEAVFLTKFATRVKLIHRRQGFRAAQVHEQEVREHPKIDLILNTIVTEIHGEDKVEGLTLRNVKTDEESYLECGGIFILIGQEPNTEFLDNVFPQYAGNLIPVDMNMETDIKGIYAVGDVRKGTYRQLATGMGEAVTAAMHSEERYKSLVSKD